jgi:hypothetical protein
LQLWGLLQGQPERRSAGENKAKAAASAPGVPDAATSVHDALQSLLTGGAQVCLPALAYIVVSTCTLLAHVPVFGVYWPVDEVMCKL